jgi:hypothetical protein
MKDKYNMKNKTADNFFDDIDFVNNPEDLGTIINRIDAELNGLF